MAHRGGTEIGAAKSAVDTQSEAGRRGAAQDLELRGQGWTKGMEPPIHQHLRRKGNYSLD